MRAPRRFFAALLLACLCTMGSATRAMEFRVVDDTLLLSGPVVGDDIARWNDLDASGRKVRLVLLHDSKGGDLFNAYVLADRIRRGGLETAVAGHCESACGLLFLAGVRRWFSDGRPLEGTMVGLHGPHHIESGAALPALAERMAWLIRDWTDGRYPKALAQRTVYPRHPEDSIFVFHPRRFAAGPRRGVMECLRVTGAQPFQCTMLPDLDGLGIGVITEPEVLTLPESVKGVLGSVKP